MIISGILKLKSGFFVLIFSLATFFSAAPLSAPAKDPAPLLNLLGSEPGVTVGTLKNGLTYYIKRNSTPKNYAQLYLTVHAGSLSEQPHERGIAHLLEHMSFKGSTHFPDQNTLFETFRNHGVVFGPHLNARTDCDETTYTLAVPTDDETLIEKSFLWLSDIASGGMTLSEAAVNSECPIVSDEERMRSTTRLRFCKKIATATVPDLDLANRLPVGTQSIRDGVPASTVKNFYKTWYRPELMAVICVGDLDPTDVKALIEKHFSFIEPSSGPYLPFSEPYGKGKVIEAYGDPELTAHEFWIAVNKERVFLKTHNDLKRSILQKLATTGLWLRTRQQQDDPASPFLDLAVCHHADVYDRSLDILGGTLKNDALAPGIDVLVTMHRQLQEHGLAASELETCKEILLAREKAECAAFPSKSSTWFAESLVTHFITGQDAALCDTLALSHLSQELIHGATLSDVNQELKNNLNNNSTTKFFALNSKLIDFDNPEKLLAELEATVAAAQTKVISPYLHNIADLASKSLSGTACSSHVETIKEIDGYKITLENGITAYFKPMAYHQDRIQISAQARGGLASFGTDHIAANLAQHLPYHMGYAGLDAGEIRQSLARYPGLWMYAHPRLLWRNLTASARVADLEFCLRTLILRCTQLNINPALFAKAKAALHQVEENARLHAQIMFERAFEEAKFEHNFLLKNPTPEEIAALTEEQLYTAYAQCFGDLTQFTFVITGNTTAEAVQQALEKTLGRLTTTAPQAPIQLPVDFGCHQPGRDIFPQRSLEQCEINIALPVTPVQYNATTERLLALAGSALQNRLRATLRTQIGQTYSPSISFDSIKPISYGLNKDLRLIMWLSGKPSEINSVLAAGLATIHSACQEGLSEEELTQAKTVLRVALTQQTQKDAYWHNKILDGVFYSNGNIQTDTEDAALIESITLQQLNDFLKEHVDTNKAYTLTLLPEVAEQGA